jgi:multiple antibiotic resistance protein
MSFEAYIPWLFYTLSALFTIVNPVSAASIFIGITEDDSIKKRKAMARKAAITSGIILVVFALLGTYILRFFGITIEAFRIAGGLLIAYVGFRMITTGKPGFRNEAEEKEARKKEDVSLIPLAIPFLSGPGAMTTAIVLTTQAPDFASQMIVLLSILLVCVASFIILSNAHRMTNFLGHSGMHVVEKIMGLIVLVIGVQFLINGIKEILFLA